MKQIKITVGMSNAGKSTWAHEQWKLAPRNTVVVNRDKIRELLFGYTEATIVDYYKNENITKFEKQVTKYEDTLIHEALAEDKTVIVDATHLDGKYINRFRYWNVPTEIVWFDIDYQEALERNEKRTRKVPVEFMESQFKKYVNLRKGFQWNYTPSNIVCNPTLPPVYLLDIDGTIAHMNDKRSPYDWKSVGVDDVCPALLPTIQAIRRDARVGIIVVSGRDGVCRSETLKWLDDNDIQYSQLLMRAENDMRPDWEIKEEIWREIAKTQNILALFDDRLQVVRRARALGLKVFNVEYNNF